MPSNLLKAYNQTLELLYVEERDNINSIKAVFHRDFYQTSLSFKDMMVVPTVADGEDTMSRLFRHLTTIVVDEKTKKREFDSDRAVRIHWIKHHIEEKKATNLIYTVKDERRIYILDKDEKYVIVFEPSRTEKKLFLLTAYKLQASRYKILMTKLEKRGAEGVQI